LPFVICRLPLVVQVPGTPDLTPKN
jgi:hypothetical protein